MNDAIKSDMQITCTGISSLEGFEVGKVIFQS